jgi:2-polyprenyl-6-methoxyphenol hydroxylase-like FAD-dependent oxidoreductase
MASIIVCGGGVIGLLTASMLARDGHEVTVLETDASEPPASPADAWESWDRKGVAQFRQPHNLFPRFRAVADDELPGLLDMLVDAGGVWVDTVGNRPPSLPQWTDRPDDDRFRFVTARRPTIEAVAAAYTTRHAGVTIRRGVKLTGLVCGTAAIDAVPNVVGVRTADEELNADLIVDAMGRRTPIAGWIEDVGGRPPQIDAADSGFVYYTRYFTGASRPIRRAPGLVPLGSISLLTLDGDNDTWSVTVFASNADQQVKALRHAELFDRVLNACPLHAHWLDGTPITDVLPMAGIVDRYHRFVVDGVPVVTGLLPVGDAWACTNPSAGRGISVGIVHAQQLRQAVREHLGNPAQLIHAWHNRTEESVSPFVHAQLAADATRFAEMTALREGRQPAPADLAMVRFMTAVGQDEVVFRALIELITCLATAPEVMGRPEIQERVARVEPRRPQPIPGPDRGQLLQLLSA